MFDYIFAQPDDREVNFSQSQATSSCGCLMVQYGRDNFPRQFDSVGCHLWTKEFPHCIIAELDYPFNAFTPRCAGIVTYKELKEHIRVKHDASPSPVPSSAA